MGLAASQARYLALTARRSDLEYQSQTINSRRIQLSYKTAEIAREYSEGMNNSKIKLSKAYKGKAGDWEELSFSNLLSAGYMLIGSEGTVLQPAPYLEDSVTEVNYDYADLSKFPTDYTTDQPYAQTLTYEQWNALTDTNMKNYFYVGTGKEIEATGTEGQTGYVPAHYATYKLVNYMDNSDKDNTYANRKAALEGWLSGSDEKLKTFAQQFTSGTKANYSYKTNPKYESENGSDIQSLLTSGQAQIVTKEFYNYLVSHGYYSPSKGLLCDKDFYTLMQQFENDSQYNSAGRKSVVDWRSDETDTFESQSFTEDDEKVLAKYEYETAKIQAQDKQLEMEEKNIETQHKAIETELENLKKVIQKNIDDTFKIFS